MSRKHNNLETDESAPAADDKKRTSMEDLELIVEGKKVMASSGLLSNNSNVFATLISNARATRSEEYDVMDMTTYQAQFGSTEKIKLEMPNLKYKDVKLMVACLQSTSITRENITGVKALRILPIVEHFRIKRLKKVCGNALYDSLIAMRKDLGPGCLSRCDVLQYLAAADQYNFEKVRRLCVEELAMKTDADSRKMLLRDKHINEKTKVKIMDKMIDQMDEDYSENLRQVRFDMDARCRKLEERRDQFMEQLEVWKNDMRQEMDDMVKANKDSHKQLLDDLQEKEIIDKMDETLKKVKESLFKEMEKIWAEYSYIFDEMQSNKILKNHKESVDLKQYLKEILESNQQNIELITKTFIPVIEKNLNFCQLSATGVGSFLSANNLEENVSRNIEDIEYKIETFAKNQIKYEEEVIAHNKTKAELTKMKVKEHQMNTWLKWATPVAEDEEKCQCFRHAAGRK